MAANPKTKRKAGEADKLIGRRIRAARLDAVHSQGGLGEAVGVSFQQVQKWENGTNRVTASNLVEIARTLDRPVAYFIADLIEPGDWGVTDVQLKMLDALEGDSTLFLEHFTNMTPIQRASISVVVTDLADAYKHRSASTE